MRFLNVQTNDPIKAATFIRGLLFGYVMGDPDKQTLTTTIVAVKQTSLVWETQFPKLTRPALECYELDEITDLQAIVDAKPFAMPQLLVVDLIAFKEPDTRLRWVRQCLRWRLGDSLLVVLSQTTHAHRGTVFRL